jgi:hypothetical protein
MCNGSGTCAPPTARRYYPLGWASDLPGLNAFEPELSGSYGANAGAYSGTGFVTAPLPRDAILTGTITVSLDASCAFDEVGSCYFKSSVFRRTSAGEYQPICSTNGPNPVAACATPGSVALTAGDRVQVVIENFGHDGFEDFLWQYFAWGSDRTWVEFPQGLPLPIVCGAEPPPLPCGEWVCGALGWEAIPAAPGTLCRPSTDSCDAAEFCDGGATSCPADRFQTAGVICRAAAGGCDVIEGCSGVSAQCPQDALKPSGQVCRNAASECDVAEYCTGTGALCGGNASASAGMPCNEGAGYCDGAGSCELPQAYYPTSLGTLEPKLIGGYIASLGGGFVSPPLVEGATVFGTVSISVEGYCEVSDPDVGYFCQFGASINRLRPNGDLELICGTLGGEYSCVAYGLVLDAGDRIMMSIEGGFSGGYGEFTVLQGAWIGSPHTYVEFPRALPFQSCGAEPAPNVCLDWTCTEFGWAAVPAWSGTVCRTGTDLCDAPEYCDGSTFTCPVDRLRTWFTCRPAAGGCDTPEQCTGASAQCPPDALKPAGQVCRYRTSACDPPETCTGASAVCPADEYLPTSASCSSSAPCQCSASHACLTSHSVALLGHDGAGNITSVTETPAGRSCPQP